MHFSVDAIKFKFENENKVELKRFFIIVISEAIQVRTKYLTLERIFRYISLFKTLQAIDP